MKYTVALLASLALLSACGSKKAVKPEPADAQIYRDDSDIHMKATERKAKMPFDTSTSAPKLAPRPQRTTNYPTE